MSAGAAARTNWAIVLAGGNGERLRALTTTRRGAIPKQYCSLHGGASLLRAAMLRARAVSLPARVTVVVAEAHRQWWARELADLPVANIVVQPANRGTAAGILLPLLAIMRRDPRALVTIVPSDHWFEEESRLRKALRQALSAARRRPSRLVLLGIRPERVEPDLGWILPMRSSGVARPVADFYEKPGPEAARLLLAAGGLLNTFIFVACADALLELFAGLLPEVTNPLLRWYQSGRAEDLAAVYEYLPPRDFSRDLLQSAREGLSVVAAPPCGWSDLGTPERVARCVSATRHDRLARISPPRGKGPLLLRLADRLTDRLNTCADVAAHRMGD